MIRFAREKEWRSQWRSAAGRCYAFGDDRRIQLGLGDTRTVGVASTCEQSARRAAKTSGTLTVS